MLMQTISDGLFLLLMNVPTCDNYEARSLWKLFVKFTTRVVLIPEGYVRHPFVLI